MKKYIKAKDVKKLFLGTSEFSLVDIREIGQHTNGHPFFSISVPYSIFESRIIDLVPSRETLIILMDHNDGLSEIVEEITYDLGYRNVQILKNGVFGWKKAGLFLFKGIHVPSKAFGELVELKKNTPHIKPSELRKKINKKDNIVIIDGRPLEEFKKMNIPTGVCCPNMEIPLRIQNEINDKTEIIINCAGRTRSIIGAQNLINFGIKNKVKALENGTQGWTLSGYKLETNKTETLNLDKIVSQKRKYQNSAVKIINKYNLKKINLKTLNSFLEEKTKNTFIFNVTANQNFAENKINLKHAPGGQLIQATESFIGVLNSKIVLIDDGELLRASLTASWLKQMGFDVYIFDDDINYLKNFFYQKKKFIIPKSKVIENKDLINFLKLNLLDIRTSHEFKKTHIKRSKWINRANLRFHNFNRKKDFLIIYNDLSKAELIYKDITSRYKTLIYFYKFDQNFKLLNELCTKKEAFMKKEVCIDFVYHTYKRHLGNRSHSLAYLNWEKDLLNHMDEEEKNRFKVV